MDIRTSLNQAAKRLQPTRIICAEDGDLGRLEAEVLLAHISNKDRAWLLAHGEETLSPARMQRFEAFVARRAGHEPIAYLLGYKDFYGRRFEVSKAVLIPRPETELLIETALAKIPAPAGKDIVWDVGTGSGAIAVTLACERPHAAVLATDESARALKVAEKNARNLEAKVTFLKSNLLQDASYLWLKERASPGAHLLVCANLPYLPMSDVKKLEKDVVDFEPSKALFSGKDGNAIIIRFLRQLKRHLPEWGYGKTTLLFEFDPPQAETLAVFAKKMFPRADIGVRKDLAGRDRLLSIVMSSVVETSSNSYR